MAYLNSDDLLAPDALHFVANFFRDNPKIDWIYSHRCTVDDDDRVIWYWIVPPHNNFLMRRWDYIPQETCFWRRSLFEKTGNIDRSYRFAMDYDLFVRFMNKGHGRRLNRFLGVFRDHSASKTKQLLETVGAQEMLRVRRKFMIPAAITDGFFGLLLGNWVQYAGRYFAAAARSLPGAFPGVGYDYNDVWGGLLRPSELRLEPKTTSEENQSYSPLCPVTLGLADRLLFGITSTRASQVVTNNIYLNSKSRVAIIAPVADTKDQTQLNNQPLVQRMNSGRSANGDIQNPPREAPRLTSKVIEVLLRLPIGARQTNVAREDRTADYILGLTRDLASANSEIAFLDANCSKGELLDALKLRTKWKLSGLEASFSAAEEALSKGHQVFNATLQQAAGVLEIVKGFDLIYLGQSIQSFDEPRASLRALAVLLNTGGLVVLSTPNLDSEQRKLFGPAWALWRPTEHRFIYSRQSLTQMLAQTGFSLTKFTTISPPESTALSLKNFNDRSISTPIMHSKKQSGMQAETIVRSCRLIWNRFGKGDVIFAVFRRIF